MRTSIRDIGRVFGALLMGIAIMSTMAGSVVGQEKKDEDRKGTSVKITVRSWDAMGKKFLKPAEVDARRTEVNGNVRFFVPVRQAIGTGEPVKGSEITEADGTVWVVKTGASTGMGEFRATVEKKAVEKKP